MNRICRQCGAEKPLWEFVDRSKQTGERRRIHRICAACRSERSKERYQQRRKEVLSYQKQYREKLKRERISFLTLKGLQSGEYRKLTPKEIKQFYDLTHYKK